MEHDGGEAYRRIMKSKLSPEEYRFHEIEKILGICFNKRGEFNLSDIDRPMLVQKISGLYALGKAPKWVSAVKAWVELVEDSEMDIDYAVMTGAVRTTWNAK